jgi:nucleoside phosphorylase/CheY-like chemotaxis protein
MRVLIVEDEREKKRLVTEAVMLAEDMSYSRLDIAGDLIEAKQFLSSNKYELIILDMNIPKRADKQAETGLGLELLDFIKNNNKAIKPTYVIGMSAYEDGTAAAVEEFNFPLWRFISFSYSDLSWQQDICDVVDYLNESNIPPYRTDGRNFHVDLCVFVALEEELKSILALDANWVELKIPHDDARYYRGVFQNSAKKLNVVAVASPEMGMPSAAIFSSKLIYTFRPKYLGIAGICAGLESKTSMGDILVSDPCFDLGSGKFSYVAAESRTKFLPALYQRRLNDTLRTDIRVTGDDKTVIDRIWRNADCKRPDKPPVVIIGPMGSGGSVIQSSEIMEQAKERHKNLIGIEMESYSVFAAAEFASHPKPLCFSIKSVCDFGNSEKSDDYHDFAAYASAQFLYEFSLSKLKPIDEEI